MSFEDELRGVIQTARSDRHRWEQEGRDFESQWNSARGSYVLAIFKEAARAFNAEQISAEAAFNNGGIVLGAVRNEPRGNYRHTLTLSPDKETRTIVCFSTTDSEKESFTLDHLSQHAVQEKVKQFADHIARGDAPRSPVFEI